MQRAKVLTGRMHALQQLVAQWKALAPRRRWVVGGATLLVFLAILALSGMAAKPRMALLYAGLEPAQAGQVVSALEQRGIAFEVRGDSIWADATQRDELRMMLASQGLPANSGNGYELLDTLSGFGTTAQMFDAAYWRAKEGELARTILSSHNIRAARVHIAVPPTPGFRNQTRPTASVSVTTATGGLSATQAKALKYLVSSAVPGMKPEDVSIIDSASGLIAGGDEGPQQASDSRATTLRENAQRVLEARVGYGKAVVEVAIESVTEREALTERHVDPQTRVAVTTDTQEQTRQSNNTRGGNVSVASNLPEGAGARDSNSSDQQNETRARTNYDVSQTTREVLRLPGDVKRLTVAVLVDGIEGKDANGQTAIVPRPDPEIAALRDLVASAVGFDEKRGDVITIRSMPFQPLAAQGSEAPGGFFATSGLDPMRLAEMAALAVVALVLGLFVMRPALLQRRPQDAEAAISLPAPPEALPVEAEDAPTPLTGDLMMPNFAMPDISLPGEGLDLPSGDDPVARLRLLIEQRRVESAEILRGWMEDSRGNG